MKDVPNYGRHAGDEDVKIYRGKDKPARPAPTVNGSRPKAARSAQKRQVRDYRDVSWKDMVPPLIAAGALVGAMIATLLLAGMLLTGVSFVSLMRRSLQTQAVDTLMHRTRFL